MSMQMLTVVTRDSRPYQVELCFVLAVQVTMCVDGHVF
jgi:hypothetical protein